MSTGTLYTTVLADGVPLVVDWAYLVSTGQYSHSLCIPLHGQTPADVHRVDFDKFQVHPEMPGWVTARTRARYNQDDIGTWKPITFYGLESEHWSAIVHYPVPSWFDFTNPADGRPVRVLSYAFRADFPKLAPE